MSMKDYLDAKSLKNSFDDKIGQITESFDDLIYKGLLEMKVQEKRVEDLKKIRAKVLEFLVE